MYSIQIRKRILEVGSVFDNVRRIRIRISSNSTQFDQIANPHDPLNLKTVLALPIRSDTYVPWVPYQSVLITINVDGLVWLERGVLVVVGCLTDGHFCFHCTGHAVMLLSLRLYVWRHQEHWWHSTPQQKALSHATHTMNFIEIYASIYVTF